MKEKLAAILELFKIRLTFLVLFSGFFGYILASNQNIDYYKLIFLVAGSFCITSAANILNQIFEKHLDVLMNRTKSRPLPTERISIDEALLISLFLILTGFGLLISKVNVTAAFLTLISMILYAFMYTPMKRISPFCVLVGAFPGALPPLIGWVAATGKLGTEAWIIFGLQFIWQFPHFWSIAWILDEDYCKAGFKMLPSHGGKTDKTAFQIMIYTVTLIPLGILPTLIGIVGPVSAVIAVLCGVLFSIQTFILMKEKSSKAAKKIMFSSFIYLPIVQITFILDKI